jgi:hypothetical protein
VRDGLGGGGEALLQEGAQGRSDHLPAEPRRQGDAAEQERDVRI